MNNQQQELFKEFFQVFSKSITKTLTKNLDADVCKKIKFNCNAFAKIKNPEDIKNESALYKIDFASGSRQGNIITLIPEPLFSIISDILTGGEGKDAYKGQLTEIETNSVAMVLTKVFKDIESTFKQAYSQDLVFSTNGQIVLKEMEEDYKINSGNAFFDFLADCTLTLNENEEYKINILLIKSTIDQLMKDLGFSDTDGGARKIERTNIDLSCLSDLEINVTAELGRAQVPIKYALELIEGSIVELDTQNNADIKVFANGVEFAYAQIVAIGENFGLKITKIITPEERMGCIK